MELLVYGLEDRNVVARIELIQSGEGVQGGIDRCVARRLPYRKDQIAVSSLEHERLVP